MPQTLSPLRYPGGKTQLYPFILNLLRENNLHAEYIEPFAGGSGIALKLLIEKQVDHIWINDYDKSIYAIWFAILNNPEKLIAMINEVPFNYGDNKTSNEKNIAFWNSQKKIYQLNKNHQHSIELAFATLFLNRTNISGIINGGPIGGSNQNGTLKMNARFNKKTLIRKINLIASKKDRIKLTRLNALDMIPQIRTQVDPNDSFIFFDPPYFEQGKNLYYSSFDESGHNQLSREILSLGDFKWITTYDKTPQISNFYQSNAQNFEYKIRYSANNKKRGKAPELLFASPTLKISSFSNTELTSI